VTPIIGNGVVVDPAVLLAEIDMLEAKACPPPTCGSRATPT